MGRAVSGFSSIFESLKIARIIGFKKFYHSITSKNTCKTCALGMGGQNGGMVNEAEKFPEICKKSIQAQLTDIQSPISNRLFYDNTIKQFQNFRPSDLERLGRLNTPLLNSKKSDYFIPIKWDDALFELIQALKNIDPNRTFFYSSGRSSNEAAFILQLFARIFGTNNINNCSYYCHQASGTGLSGTIGSGTATLTLDDLQGVDMFWVQGANPSSNHPRFMKELLRCRRRGGEVIFINPLKEPGLENYKVPSDFRAMAFGDHKIATDYIQPNIGGDIALLKGVCKALIDQKIVDEKFIEKYTNGYIDFAEDIISTSWDDIERSSGIDSKKIFKLAKKYAKAENVAFAWSMGITQHLHGVANVESIVNLALLRGMVGKKKSGLLPLRGHSNVQGVGSMGLTPSLKKDVLSKITKELGVDYPESPGMDTISCLKAAEMGEIDFSFLMGGNLFSASPDRSFSDRALGNIPFKVFLTTTLNEGHFSGIGKKTLILPVAARDEERQSTTQESMFNFVRMSDGGMVRLDNVRSEVDIISTIAEKVVGNEKINFSVLKSHSNIRETIGTVIPGYEKIKSIDKTKEEFQISGRIFDKPTFATPDKKANFKMVNIPQIKDEKYKFRMASIRSEGQFNTIIYEEHDSFRKVNHRWTVLMNINDMLSLNLKEKDKVTIQNNIGSMEHVTVKRFNLPPGNVATYFPESNILIPKDIDLRSNTPSFKSIFVDVIPVS
tara:strand:+ start:18997 stop:21168 length:2172 start_codon:yes stop_codon:yes gene_type:complete